MEKQYILGSAADCHVHLAGPGVKPRHAELSVTEEQLKVTPLVEDAAISVDGSIIAKSTPLGHNSVLDLGGVKLRVVDPKKLKKPPITTTATPVHAGWYLQSKTTALANKRFTIDGSMVVGRAKECDISLGVAHLSRKHARLNVEDGELWVEDLGSSNGTYLNGERVDRARVKNGDELGFDTLVFSVFGESGSDIEDNGDKTSLRPVLRTELPVLSVPAKFPRASAVARNKSVESKARPSQVSNSMGADAGSNLRLWIGIGCAGILTLLAILYVLS